MNVLYERKRMVRLGHSYEEVCSTNSLRNIMYDVDMSLLQPVVEFSLCTSRISFMSIQGLMLSQVPSIIQTGP